MGILKELEDEMVILWISGISEVYKLLKSSILQFSIFSVFALCKRRIGNMLFYKTVNPFNYKFMIFYKLHFSIFDKFVKLFPLNRSSFILSNLKQGNLLTLF